MSVCSDSEVHALGRSNTLRCDQRRPSLCEQISGCTALHCALKCKQLPCVKALLKLRAKTTIQTPVRCPGRCPLQASVAYPPRIGPCYLRIHARVPSVLNHQPEILIRVSVRDSPLRDSAAGRPLPHASGGGRWTGLCPGSRGRGSGLERQRPGAREGMHLASEFPQQV